jgi:hypothetical protein
MRQAIIDYKLNRQSLRDLVNTLEGSFEIGSPILQSAKTIVENDLALLEAIAESGDDRSPQVERSLDAIEAAVAG